MTDGDKKLALLLDNTPSRYLKANVDTNECTGCQACEEICPRDAIDIDKEKIIATVNLDRCDGCGLCVRACQFNAITLKEKK